jgi:hypothetical protein
MGAGGRSRASGTDNFGILSWTAEAKVPVVVIGGIAVSILCILSKPRTIEFQSTFRRVAQYEYKISDPRGSNESVQGPGNVVVIFAAIVVFPARDLRTKICAAEARAP